jgi:hypothetical protein
VRVLLLHPEDSPRYGPWARQQWDLIVDLGNSSETAGAAWQKLVGCPVLRLESFRHSVDDPRSAGEILRSGFGQLMDDCGLDWWELTSLFVHAELETAIALRRLAASGDSSGELFSTRPDWPVSGFATLLGRDVRSFSETAKTSAFGRLRRYARAFSKLSASQMVEVFWDKYDSGYEWRSRLIARTRRISESVVLLPSAYTNVSRMAAAYASLLPEQRFLLVATRRSGLQFDRPSNVNVTQLARYAKAGKHNSENATILSSWAILRAQLQEIPEVDLLSRAGVLDPFERWFRTGLAVRDAWRCVLDHEPVTAVLCGDDSNWYTRLPVMLGRMRGLPTVDFHHGAFDGRYLLKRLSSDFYLAKSEMERDYLLRVCHLPAERVLVGAPVEPNPLRTATQGADQSSIIFFSEPAESFGGRTEEVYRELIPPLLQIADKHRRTLILKLHPFENARERSRLLESALGPERRAKVKIVSGPLSAELLETAWFGITVESTTAVDCARHSAPCFLCEWLVAMPFGYIQQYARFGIGRLIRSPSDLAEIPRILCEEPLSQGAGAGAGPRIEASTLQGLFTGRCSTVSN